MIGTDSRLTLDEANAVDRYVQVFAPREADLARAILTRWILDHRAANSDE